jgi:hypothetical protein
MDELLQKVEAYLNHTISREAFELWLYDLAFDVETSGDKAVVELTHEIEALLAESSAANWSIQSLNDELRTVVAQFRPIPLHRRAG